MEIINLVRGSSSFATCTGRKGEALWTVFVLFVVVLLPCFSIVIKGSDTHTHPFVFGRVWNKSTVCFTLAGSAGLAAGWDAASAAVLAAASALAACFGGGDGDGEWGSASGAC